MLITDIFYCKNLNGTLSFRTCLLRQISKRDRGNDGFVSLYVECRNCTQGQAIKQEFKDVKIETSEKLQAIMRVLQV